LFHSRIEDLNAVVSLSPFFYQENVNLVDSVMSLNNRELNSSKYYRFGIGNDFPDQFYAMDSVLKTVDHPMINASGKLFREADHNVTPGLTIAPALYDIFEYWSAAQAVYFDNDNKDFGQLAIQSQNIREHYGSNLNFALGILNGKGWYFYNEGKFEMAIAAWREMMMSYPNFSEGFLYIVYAEQELGRNTEQSEKFLRNSLEKSQIYSDDEKAEILNEIEK
jgi:tetratricopeptide (TPR) repeat protein